MPAVERLTLTRDEVATILGCSIRKVSDLTHQGVLSQVHGTCLYSKTQVFELLGVRALYNAKDFRALQEQNNQLLEKVHRLEKTLYRLQSVLAGELMELGGAE